MRRWELCLRERSGGTGWVWVGWLLSSRIIRLHRSTRLSAIISYRDFEGRVVLAGDTFMILYPALPLPLLGHMGRAGRDTDRGALQVYSEQVG